MKKEDQENTEKKVEEDITKKKEQDALAKKAQQAKFQINDMIRATIYVKARATERGLPEA